MPPKILLVDDNQELLTLLARLVEAEGWTPVPVGKGKSAIDAIPSEKPAAAVVDVLLPDMMGYDVAHALKNAQVPFVFMTGVFKGGRAAADAAGASAGFFCSQPATATTLRSRAAEPRARRKAMEILLKSRGETEDEDPVARRPRGWNQVRWR